jgi:hypothetical protein
MKSTITAINLAKHAFQICRIEPDTGAIHNKTLKRARPVPLFTYRPSSHVTKEGCDRLIIEPCLAIA